jgi:hypothetical protein
MATTSKLTALDAAVEYHAACDHARTNCEIDQDSALAAYESAREPLLQELRDCPVFTWGITNKRIRPILAALQNKYLAECAIARAIYNRTTQQAFDNFPTTFT